MPEKDADNRRSGNDPATTPRKFHASCFFLAFFILLAVWLVLSGKFDVFHVSLGIVSCLLVAYFSYDLLFSGPAVCSMTLVWLRFILYIPWLCYQIFLANLRILYLVFHPRGMEMIDPEIIEFKSGLKSELALLTFANSITLTPGTITVFVSIYGDFKVHAIDRPSGAALPGEMETRIAGIFGE